MLPELVFQSYLLENLSLLSICKHLLSVADQNHQDGRNTAENDDEGQRQQGAFGVA